MRKIFDLQSAGDGKEVVLEIANALSSTLGKESYVRVTIEVMPYEKSNVQDKTKTKPPLRIAE